MTMFLTVLWTLLSCDQRSWQLILFNQSDENALQPGMPVSLGSFHHCFGGKKTKSGGPPVNMEFGNNVCRLQSLQSHGLVPAMCFSSVGIDFFPEKQLKGGDFSEHTTLQSNLRKTPPSGLSTHACHSITLH